jgi:hypothetical protein
MQHVAVFQARIHVLHVPALFELQNTFQGELSE